jgi:preprotein translocase subunit SecG
MITILMVFIILVAVFLMFIVLIQASKGGGLAGTFGGSDASMVFGVRRTSDFLIKLTTALATIFLLFSLITNVIINRGAGTQESIIQQNSGQQQYPQQQVPTETPNQQPGNQQPGNQQPGNQEQGNQPPSNQNPTQQPPK